MLFGEISPAKLLATKQTEAKDSNVSGAAARYSKKQTFAAYEIRLHASGSYGRGADIRHNTFDRLQCRKRMVTKFGFLAVNFPTRKISSSLFESLPVATLGQNDHGYSRCEELTTLIGWNKSREAGDLAEGVAPAIVLHHQRCGESLDTASLRI